MTHKIDQIPVIWNMEEIAGLQYFYEKFNDDQAVQSWSTIYPNLRFTTGDQADYRVQQPRFTQDILASLPDHGLSLHHSGTSYYRMNPGDLLPYHQDRYVNYCRYHDTDPGSIWRIIIFLQDWQPGFLFEIDGQAVSAYPAGTFVAWQGHTPHMAGNLAQIARYTLQITGIQP